MTNGKKEQRPRRDEADKKITTSRWFADAVPSTYVEKRIMHHLKRGRDLADVVVRENIPYSRVKAAFRSLVKKGSI